jgi:hypothetical protein
MAWNSDQPIVRFIKRWLPVCLPRVHRIGGYVNRATETGAFSFHSEGRAVDIYVLASDSEELRIGDALFDRFIQYAADLGVDHVIWNRHIWSADQAADGVRDWPADRNPHTNHVHVAFTRPGSQQEPGFLIAIFDGISIELYGRMAGESP